jgi:hypothetical protein
MSKFIAQSYYDEDTILNKQYKYKLEYLRLNYQKINTTQVLDLIKPLLLA